MRTAATVYRELLFRGIPPSAAGNMTAYLMGLHPAESGWTLAEIEHLLFLDSLVTSGRLTAPPLPTRRGRRRSCGPR